jgi:predicted nuclease of predicted toxin-antitoxin system
MPPQVKVDEDLPDAVASLFAAVGYPATTVRAQGWSGLQDAPLWTRLQAEGRWLVTADKGFGDIRTYTYCISRRNLRGGIHLRV